jgi:hypothetical protein
VSRKRKGRNSTARLALRLGQTRPRTPTTRGVSRALALAFSRAAVMPGSKDACLSRLVPSVTGGTPNAFRQTLADWPGDGGVGETADDDLAPDLAGDGLAVAEAGRVGGAEQEAVAVGVGHWLASAARTRSP